MCDHEPPHGATGSGGTVVERTYTASLIEAALPPLLHIAAQKKSYFPPKLAFKRRTSLDTKNIRGLHIASNVPPCRESSFVAITRFLGSTFSQNLVVLGTKNILMDQALRPSLSAAIEELMKDGSGGSCSQDKPGQANRLFYGMAYKDISSR